MIKICVRQSFGFFKFSTLSSQQLIALENQFGCQNYAPIPVVLARGEGINLWDCEGKKYMDFLAGYSAVNQGHCHPRILKTLVDQASKLTHTGRAFYNNQLGLAEKMMCEMFKYDKVLFMNSGSEAGETAVKLARRWAYNVKGVPDNQARLLFANGNFWGRTISACASSDDPERYRRFGPYGGLNFDMVDYDNLDQIEKAFQSSNDYAAIFIEPIQGEQGVIIPRDGYLKGVHALCKKYNILFICDEIQTGLGRTGKMLACDWEQVRPDIITLAKSISGGFYPISAILTDDEVMNQIRPGEHGSTFGGNPLGSAILQTSLQVIVDENLVENSRLLGEVFKKGMLEIKSDLIKEIRGRGLMVALEFTESARRKIALEFTLRLAKKGLLCKTSQEVTVRFTPPLVMKLDELERGIQIIQETFKELEQGTTF